MKLTIVGGIEWNGHPCIYGRTGTRATRFNVDTIRIVGGVETQVVQVEDAPLFGPGATDEPGTSDEIEFDVELGDGFDAVEIVGLRLDGASGSDTIVLGTDGINLNAAETDGIDSVTACP